MIVAHTQLHNFLGIQATPHKSKFLDCMVLGNRCNVVISPFT